VPACNAQAGGCTLIFTERKKNNFSHKELKGAQRREDVLPRITRICTNQEEDKRFLSPNLREFPLIFLNVSRRHFLVFLKK